MKNKLTNILNKTVLPMGLSALLGLTSCVKKEDIKRGERVMKELRGIPINVQLSSDNSWTPYHLAVTIKDKNGEYQVFSHPQQTIGVSDICSAAALIQSEIDDSDNEPITLKATLNSNYSHPIWSAYVTANGKTIKIR